MTRGITLVMLILGAGIGAALFFVFFELPSTTESARRMNMNRFSGVIQDMDPVSKTFTIIVQDRYPLYEEPRVVKFEYDDETLWASFDYQFENESVARRLTSLESPRDLPNGTMVTAAARDDVGKFRAESIIFIRRTNL